MSVMEHKNTVNKISRFLLNGISRCKSYKVSEFADIIGGSTPSTKNDDYWDGDIPWITPKDLSQYNFRYITNGSRYISEAGLSSIGNKMIPTNSILLTTRAPVGYLAIAAIRYALTRVRSLLVGPDPLYIYYLLKANLDYLKSNATSTFQKYSSVLKSLEFRILLLKPGKRNSPHLGTDDKMNLTAG